MARNSSYLPVTRDFAYSADGDAVEPPLSSPPLSSPGTLARFEFESGKGNEGTKILLVEWASTSSSSCTASIYWENMPDGGCLSVTDPSSRPSVSRKLFLLPSYSPIPRNVYISTAQENLQTNPLPAIFPGKSSDGGSKGVLHTAFAMGRLQDLESEIEREARVNSESVAVDMASQEKGWIEREYFFAGPASRSSSKDKKSSSKSKDKGKSKKSSSPKISSKKHDKRSEKKQAQVEVYEEEEEESESDLFATSMGPRAPDAVMSPYSLRTPDYVPWR